MNASEKRILKLAIILFIIGLIVRYLPWGLPSIETFEVGDAVIVANPVPALDNTIQPAIAGADAHIVVDKVENAADPLAESLADESSAGNRKPPTAHEHHRKSKKKVELPLHINTATADDLCALKGVGPKLAEKIIERRNAAGPFKNPSDLKKVHGIGKKKLENLLHSIIFD
jgi:competence protein ComEA